jgi:tRNA(Arg) A34 adenosine deaminase TadA
MIVMDTFEKAPPGSLQMGGYSLYTSLESCPMCLCRMILAGLGTVAYVCDDLP